MKKQIMFSIVMILIVIGLFGLVNGETLISDAGVEYDSEIPKAFNNQTLAQEMLNESGFEILKISDNQVWIRLLIRLNDNSGIEIIGTTDKKIELMKQRDKWFEPVIEDVLFDLSESEIKDIRRRSDGFSAMITKDSFNKLTDDPRIKKI